MTFAVDRAGRKGKSPTQQQRGVVANSARDETRQLGIPKRCAAGKMEGRRTVEGMAERERVAVGFAVDIQIAKWSLYYDCVGALIIKIKRGITGCDGNGVINAVFVVAGELHRVEVAFKNGVAQGESIAVAGYIGIGREDLEPLGADTGGALVAEFHADLEWVCLFNIDIKQALTR